MKFDYVGRFEVKSAGVKVRGYMTSNGGEINKNGRKLVIRTQIWWGEVVKIFSQPLSAANVLPALSKVAQISSELKR